VGDAAKRVQANWVGNRVRDRVGGRVGDWVRDRAGDWFEDWIGDWVRDRVVVVVVVWVVVGEGKEGMGKRKDDYGDGNRVRKGEREGSG